MEKPEVVECCDGHYRRTIWGLGPYTGDYPKQILLTCVVQGWCPRYAFYHYLCSINSLHCDMCRCQAFHDNLNDEDLYQCPHTRELMEALINTYEVPTLWSEYGIVADVVVRFATTISFSISNKI